MRLEFYVEKMSSIDIGKLIARKRFFVPNKCSEIHELIKSQLALQKRMLKVEKTDNNE